MTPMTRPLSIETGVTGGKDEGPPQRTRCCHVGGRVVADLSLERLAARPLDLVVDAAPAILRVWRGALLPADRSTYACRGLYPVGREGRVTYAIAEAGTETSIGRRDGEATRRLRRVAR